MPADRLSRRNTVSVLPRNATRARGFTLVELLTVVAVLVVFAMIAVPSFNELIASQRVQIAATDLFTSLLRARSQPSSKTLTSRFRPPAHGPPAGPSPPVERISIRTRRRTISPSAIRGW
ncbi:MAG: prepilin-type N-terminal cleavage/methylation domain-containing protein [Betaproteobacteria bacterium]|nr:MAG: prepilin-type N-terminal cleavage/methylation domain-containing protein [Betaproteobacteria bacterium]